MPTITHTDETAWLDALVKRSPSPGVDWLGLSLNRTGQAGIGDVTGYNIPDSHNAVVFRFDGADQATETWYPQGIAGSSSAGHPGSRSFLAVSWYGKDTQQADQKGARVSFLDVTDPAHVHYRHVLLVQNRANIDDAELFRMGDEARARYNQRGDFAPVPIHAGGMAWVGNLLYVADTTLGLRVFDLRRMLPAAADPDKNQCGTTGSTFYAFDYRYILAQVGYYKITGIDRFSSVSLDNGAHALWTGQYQKPTDGSGIISRFALQETGDHLDTASSVTQTEPRDKRGGTVHYMQGVLRDGPRTWLSITGQQPYKGSNARLITWAEGDARGKRWRWPHGAEDLYHDAATDLMWCLMEHPGRRAVFAVERSTYPMPADAEQQPDALRRLAEDVDEQAGDVVEFV